VESELVGDLGGVHSVGQILRTQQNDHRGQRVAQEEVSEGSRETNLLVGKDKKKSVSELVLVEHSSDCDPQQHAKGQLKLDSQPTSRRRRDRGRTLLPSLRDTLSIVGVNDEDNSLGVLEVCQRNVAGKLPRCPMNAQKVFVDSQCLQRGRILS
jgi:hypothetical protein